MRWNDHSELEGRHAHFSPSSPAWLRYDDAKLERSYVEALASMRGTEEHAYAAMAIKLGHKQSDEPKTINMYINECIGFRMRPEVALYWSPVCFGTADALHYSERTQTLRVSDLKTGKTRASWDQLIIYAALFCLEYEKPRPQDLRIELRIYQNNEVKLLEPEPHDVFIAMDRILMATRLVEQIWEDRNA